ncbi:unnamed protein product [Cochlearia groenlandica]
MARSLSNAKILFVAQEFSNAIFRRGFAVATKTASEGCVSKKIVQESSGEKAPWVPDPKTGYYRPETGSEEIDPAELRAILLNNKQLIN